MNPYSPIIQAWTNPLLDPNPLHCLSFKVQKVSLKYVTKQRERLLFEKSFIRHKDERLLLLESENSTREENKGETSERNTEKGEISENKCKKDNTESKNPNQGN